MSNNNEGPCVVCEKHLEAAMSDGVGNRQPYGGGEIRLYFGYGSCKFDDNIWGTSFAGLICDDCAEKFVPKMERLTDNHHENPPPIPDIIASDPPSRNNEY